MGQLAGVVRRLIAIVFATLAGVLVSCDRPADRQPSPPATQSTQPTIACVMPAATDILVAMGLQDRIVGVSNYEPADSPVAGVASVGDYHALDWEGLYRIKPGVLIVPRQKRTAEPLVMQRASQIGMKLIDVHIDTLNDIYLTIAQLGEQLGERERAAELSARMKTQLEALRARTESRPAVRTLVVMDEHAQFAVGAPSYLDDLLTIAGGKNVLAGEMKDYPKIDLERLIEMNPEAVIQLLPGAPPQLVESAKAFWAKLPKLSAVRNGKVYIHTETHLMLPGARVVEVARMMADDLHPLTTGREATTTDGH